jgi:hypothetical protein
VGEPTAVVTGLLRGPIGRLILATAGLGMLAYLLRGAGPERVARVLWEARSWMPAILAFEIVQILGDVMALRFILRRRAAEVPASTWIRSSAIAYAMMILLPAGRAAGEVGRATLIAEHVGTPAALNASALLQAVYVFAIGLASAAACAVVASSFGILAPLALLLAANAALMFAIAGGLLEIARNAPLGRWFQWARSRLAHPRAATPAAPLAPSAPVAFRLPWRSALACVTARTAQLVQYGVLLAAVGGTASVRGAFIAHGIHLVGATMGDAVPNQLGVVDGTYRAFAAALGFADAPARALSIAFVAHAVQMTLAGLCVIVAAVTRRTRAAIVHGAGSPLGVTAK